MSHWVDPGKRSLRRVFTRSLLPQAIPFDPEVGRAMLLGKPILTLNPQSPAAKQYSSLAQHLGLTPNSENETVDLFKDMPGQPPTLKSPPMPVKNPDGPSLKEVREMLGVPVPEIVASLEGLTPLHLPKPTSPTIASMRSPIDKNRIEDVPASSANPSPLSGSKDGNVKLWETSGSEDRASFRGHTGDVTSLAFFPGWQDDRHGELGQDRQGLGSCNLARTT